MIGRSVHYRNTSKLASRAARVLPAVLTGLFVFGFAGIANAGGQNLSTLGADVMERTSLLPDVFVYVSYVIGVAMCALGVNDLRRTTESPSNHSMKIGIAKLFAGGALLAVAPITGVVQGTIKGNSTIRADYDPDISFKFSKSGSGDGLDKMISSFAQNMDTIPEVASFVAFVIGVFFTVRAIQMLRDHTIDGRSVPIAEPVKRFAVAGAMFSLGYIARVVINTFGTGTATELTNSGWSVKDSAGGGLDSMFINFTKSLANPSIQLIEFFCYVAGILLILFALQRMVRTAQDGPRGPLGFGTIMTFFVAGALLSFPQMLALSNNTLFADGTKAATKVCELALKKAAGGDDLTVQAKNIISACLMFLAIVGYLSFVRGLFILKSFADGNGQATMMSACTHLIAGSIAVNLGTFINLIQNSLGVTDKPIGFC